MQRVQKKIRISSIVTDTRTVRANSEAFAENSKMNQVDATTQAAIEELKSVMSATDKQLYRGFEIGVLRAAFNDITKGMPNWKFEIRGDCAPGQEPLVAAAIEFFTASKTEFYPEKRGILTWVPFYAAGYYASCGA